jgi:hypothetical protein
MAAAVGAAVCVGSAAAAVGASVGVGAALVAVGAVVFADSAMVAVAGCVGSGVSGSGDLEQEAAVPITRTAQQITQALLIHKFMLDFSLQSGS